MTGLSRRLLLAYGLPGLPLAALMLPLYVHLPAFYARDLGLGFAVVGLVLLIARLTDVVSDPLVGLLSDRLAGRFGRRRIWMVAGLPVVLVAVHMLFRPAAEPGPIYLLAWTAAVYLGGTMILLPYGAWGAEISPDYDQRSRIAAAREGFLVVGTLLAAGLPVLLGVDGGAVLGLLAWALTLALPLAVIAAVAMVPEPPFIAGRPTHWRHGLRLLRRNGPFRRLIAAYLLNGIANGLPASLFLLFVAHVLQRAEWSGALLFIYFAAGIAGIPLWLRLSAKYGKHRVWSAAMVGASAVFAFVPLLGPGDLAWFFAICVLTGLTLGADLTLPASMQADVIDLDTLRGGRQRTGVYFAIWGMATKLALALAVGIAFPLLELVGFDAAVAANPARATLTLAMLYSLAPVLFKLAAVAVFRGYPITAGRQRRIRRLIRARYAGA